MRKEFEVSNRNRDSWRFRPNGKAPSSEWAFLVSETPHIGKAQRPGTGDGGGMLTEPEGSLNLRPSGSSSVTPNSAWNCGRSFLEY